MTHPEEILNRLFNHAKHDDYKGYNKHDGLLSPILGTTLGWSKIGRLIAIQSLMRAPINLRRYFLVPKTKNPKGIGLFAHAYLDAADVCTDKANQLEAEVLLQWLINSSSKTFTGKSWGYQYPWQDVGFFAHTHLSNRVVTCWIGYAFHRAYINCKDHKYLSVCDDICQFLLSEPNRIVDTDTELCLSYVPDRRVNWAVMDVSALCAKMLALTGTSCDNQGYLEEAKRCITYVMNRQTDYHAWYYTDPPKDSHITHDNYHTGIILDCILDYMITMNDFDYKGQYLNGLEFYKEHIFLSNGAPKWMNNKVYPHDIHGAAQGIISFSKASVIDASSLDFAKQIFNWTIDNLYDEKKGVFWYQRNKFFTKKFTLLRWCNGWMARAIGELLLAERRINEQ